MRSAVNCETHPRQACEVLGACCAKFQAHRLTCNVIQLLVKQRVHSRALLNKPVDSVYCLFNALNRQRLTAQRSGKIPSVRAVLPDPAIAVVNQPQCKGRSTFRMKEVPSNQAPGHTRVKNTYVAPRTLLVGFGRIKTTVFERGLVVVKPDHFSSLCHDCRVDARLEAEVQNKNPTAGQRYRERKAVVLQLNSRVVVVHGQVLGSVAKVRVRRPGSGHAVCAVFVVDNQSFIAHSFAP